ncbi:MAG: helix-turn-helix domain-containing protein [Dysgonamonadaceae bacterium]|jgi:transcriptional regulator with XRE-family HTH domain|nr:helix-turn-helix domain-containing protein [Dysgonamonadaceae bacterium]
MNLQLQIVSKVKRLRLEKGLSQSQMAELLNMEKSVYARLETGKTYSWAKYLEELLVVFEITPDKFFEDIGANVVINDSNYPCGKNANIENLYSKNREIYEKLIAAKDEQIAFLKSRLEKK